ncbi:aminopeptidase N [Hydrogenovibrio marinus]|uniref:Aminopeptidase N n=1 Tax=Hydrogenovibrio marinus TaxID=28885 RepID=A0A066ZZG8_HYDMR|nr:aminopeptidase N [Hydrogenovibrio marinus]KDN95520.1 aminopeptidase [Hydrogenovibrio marinus]BBN60012.1 aminopeptidase N [Hydrogenovibrio marinus]
MSIQQPKEIFLKDYRPLDFEIESVDLTFELDPSETLVTNRMKFVRKTDQSQLKLDGEHLVLVSIEKDGKILDQEDFYLTETDLTLNCPEQQFELVVKTRINPEANTRLEGLYRSSGNYCTQCEAEGFRTITYYLDRPDCLSYFTTKIIGDECENKVLLSNGNLIEFGELEGGKHFAVWEDPHKKPCYLFALVAGNLEVVEGHFETKDSRRVDLRLYVQENNLDKCDHAMASLKKSMKWDEERFGLIYDLDVYMVVAVDDFNMGAMENKGLNVFNSKFVLAKPETATDVDFEGIESVIAHEYFHNWTGNRVTCRDWFQLTLKEGLTIFRDQEFTSDMLSPAVKRIEDVKRLRSFQFPEDAGPMSHPIQPQSYIEMNNFYTMTVYEKGAEVVRLYQTLLGRDGFRKGMDLYFDRFDGQAVTVEDFRNAMADANQRDLSQMHHWYIQPGTPKVTVTKQYDAGNKTLSLSFKQTLNGKQEHLPLLIPVVFDVLSPSNEAALSFSLSEVDQSRCSRADNGWLFELTKHDESLVLQGVEEEGYLSLFRGFSAPILLDYACTQDELVALASYDSDSFVRWESIQTLALMNLIENVQAVEDNREMVLSEYYAKALESNLADTSLDLALKSLAITLPDESYLQEALSDKGMLINTDSILAVYGYMKQTIAEKFESSLLAIYQQMQSSEAYRYDKDAIAHRMLKNRCLNYLSKLPAQQDWMQTQFDQQSNMTDVFAALEAMKPYDSVWKKANLADFYHKWNHDDLVLDKWFALQASDQSDSALDLVKSLVEHADFHYTNPNRARSVLGVFGRMNMKGFHHASGEGYAFLASEVLKLDKINPQVAARIVSPFTQWKRYDVARQEKMKSQLTKLIESGSLSKDVYEIVSKSLK